LLKGQGLLNGLSAITVSVSDGSIQSFRIVDVFIMTDHANNNVIVFGRDNRDFITDTLNLTLDYLETCLKGK
jgi:phage terminase large subunit GpA-like protein